MSPESLWQRVKTCFETDDGSLPDFALEHLTSEEVARLYADVRACSKLEGTAELWDEAHAKALALDAVPNAAALVGSGQAAPFHFVVNGLQVDDVALPSLGFLIFQDSVAIDYRMGPHWGPRTVHALFTWLRRALARTRAGALRVRSNEPPPDAAAFQAAWDDYVKASVH